MRRRDCIDLDVRSLTGRWLGLAFALGAAMAFSRVHADPMSTLSRIGVMVPPVVAMEEGLREGLRELGYVEGKNMVIEWRRSEGETNEELRRLAIDLVLSKPDVIVASNTASAQAVMAATSTTPVVFISGDPVARGLVHSLAQPGGNATGLSVVSPDLTAKRLELLHKLVPRARRIAYLANPARPVVGPQLQEAAQTAARALGVRLETFSAVDAREIERALAAIRRSRVDAALVSSDPIFVIAQARIAQTMRANRVPAAFPYQESRDEGALISYGISLRDMMTRTAPYVDKILKGVKPSELPVEQISTYKLTIDLRVAKQLGLAVPQELLLRADEVIR